MPLREARRIADEDTVRTYQQTMYAAVLAAGVWALVSGGIPNAVGQILGPAAHIGWVGLLIVSPIAVFVGMRIELRRTVGLWLQLAGNAGVAAALATYVLALSRTVYAGHETFAIWVVLGLMVCAAYLVRRDWRRIRVVAQVVRRMEMDSD